MFGRKKSSLSALSVKQKQELSAEQSALGNEIYKLLPEWEVLSASHFKEGLLKGHDLRYKGEVYRVINDRRTVIEESNIEKCTLTLVERESLIKSVLHKHTLELHLHHESRRADGNDDIFKQIILDNNVIDSEIDIKPVIGYAYLLNNLKSKILESSNSAVNYRQLMHSYKSTLELADAYNKADAFSSWIKEDGKTFKSINPHKDHLLQVANDILDSYSKIRNPSRAQIFEVANLSALDNSNISRDIFNILIKGIDSLTPDSVEIPNLDKIEAVSRMLMLLPPGFISENHADIVIKILSKMSGWLEKQNVNIQTQETQVEKFIPILQVYAHMVSSVLDNAQLQQMNMANRELSVGVMLSKYRKRLMKGMFNNFDKKNMPATKKLLGEGLCKKTRDDLSKGLKVLLDNSYTPMSVQYLASYIEQSISRLAEEGDTDFAQVIRRSKHLMLGASGLCLMALGGGGALSDFKELIKHATKSLKDSRSNNEEWYDTAKYLSSMISEAHGDSEKLGFLLNEIGFLYGDKNEPKWQIIYVILERFFEAAEKTRDENIINELMRFALERSVRTGYSKQTQKVSIEFLVSAASSPVKEIRNLAKKYIKNEIYPVYKSSAANNHDFSSTLLMNMECIEAVRIKEYNNELDSNDLLYKAKAKKFPIELKASNLREKVEELCRESLIEDSLSSYIPLTGAASKYSTDESKFFSLEKNVKSFIEEKRLAGTPTLLIHGNAGAGKSLFGRYIEKKYWSEYEHGRIIPLMISLPSLQNPAHKAIEQALSEYGFTKDDILELKAQKHKDQVSFKKIWQSSKNEDDTYKKDDSGRFSGVEEQKENNSPRLLVILDGYDEINGKMNIHNAYDTSSWKNIKVIITSRTDYLDKMPKQDLFGKDYEEVFIRPFDEKQIKSFIEKRFNIWEKDGDIKAQSGLTHKNFEDLILGNKDLSLIIEHPFMLEIVMEILPQLKEQKLREHILDMASSEQRYLSLPAEDEFTLGKVTRYDIYDLFLSAWFKREGLRQREMAQALPEDFNPEYSAESYAISVAVFMFINGIQAIKGDSINHTRTDALVSQGSKFFGSETKTLSRKATPLKKIGDMRYAFIHKSIQEFLVAKGMLEEIRSLALEKNREVMENDILNTDYIQKDSSVLRFVLDGITPKELAALERVILSTRENTKSGIKSPIVVAAANSATLYVRTIHTQAVIGRDWSNTQITGADISGAYFYGMDFTNCNWANVVARSMTMMKCNCNNMDLTNINTGEYANLLKHKHSVSSVSLTDKYVLSSSNDVGIIFWDRYSGAFVRSINDNDGVVSSISSYGNYFVSCSESSDGSSYVKIWDLRSFDVINQIKDSEDKFKVIYAYGQYLFSVMSVGRSTKNVFKVWNIRSGNFEKKLDFKDLAHSICANENYVFSETLGSSIEFFELGSWNYMGALVGHTSEVKSIYPYGKYLFSGSADCTVRVWDIENKTCLKILKGHDCQVNSVVAYDQYVFSGSADKTVRIWYMASGECLRVFMGHTDIITSMVVSGQHIFSGSADKTIRIWDIHTDSILGHNLGIKKKGDVSSMYVKYPYVFTCTRDGSLRIYHIESGALFKVIENSYGVSYSLYATNDYLFSGYKNGLIRVYEINSGNYVRSLSNNSSDVFSISGVGRYIVSGSRDHKVRVWDIDSGKCVILEAHKGSVNCVYAIDNYIFSCSDDYSIRIWSLDEGELLADLTGHNHYVNVIAADNKHIISASVDKKIKVWDIERRVHLRELSGFDSKINDLAVYGQHIFSCSTDVTIRVWDIDSGDCNNILFGHSSSVIGLASYATNLISVDSSGMTIVWDISNILDIKILRAFGRQGWEQPLRLIDNNAESLCGLSEQSQRLFEQHNFKANFKEPNALKSNIGEQSLVDSLRAEIALLKEQQASLTAVLRSVFSGANLEIPTASSPLTSSNIAANASTATPAPQEGQRNGNGFSARLS